MSFQVLNFLGLAILALASKTSATPTSSNLNTRADTSGCGKSHNGGFHDANDAHTIQSGGRTRTYGIYVPEDYNQDTNRQRKLIIDYHGRNGSPAGQYGNSKYDAYAAGKEYIIVYPAGVNAAWQGASYAADGVNDVQFTKDLLAHMRQQYCIDSEHVYASGKSNGGGFVDTLACSDVGDEFAAFAMAAAALYTDNSKDSCKKKRAVFEAHGVKDDTILYGGGQGAGGVTPNIGTWVSWWAQRDGCSVDVKKVTKKDGYEITTYSCNGLEDLVKHYRIYELGHCWPSATGDNTDGSRPYCKDHSVDFTDRVLYFFSRWSLSNAPKN